jgi:alpha,alpha-trehalose phosphorylase
VKQADLVLASYLAGEHFTLEQKRRDFDYYERITVRDSSLSAAIQAVVAAEVGYLDLAYEYFRETSLIDLADLASNVRNGLHLASLGGAWLVAVAGFGGMRESSDILSFAPRLPSRVTRLSFRLTYQGRCIQVGIDTGTVRYELMQGKPIDLLHYGTQVRLKPGLPSTLPLPPVEEVLRTGPPFGRPPMCEGSGDDGGELAAHLPGGE